jgi:hypothetical protein
VFDHAERAAERREPAPHIHVDHLYFALVEASAPAPGAELPFAWYAADQLAAADMFADTRVRAVYLLDRIGILAEVTAYGRVPGSRRARSGRRGGDQPPLVTPVLG